LAASVRLWLAELVWLASCAGPAGERVSDQGPLAGLPAWSLELPVADGA
jgi:hypothetical protein